ncbi:RNA polymerase sigma factor [Porticoccus sp. W117]|uniref:RNA polymerase sigma factor n=1 Tax=Porticoccus sp. W117 TaxID=3054777 RepID=UPI0025962CBF|nr:RNA polymerase sigma factor [Porticoccus sp. W117]MDM3872017.1 RNA polymerase sigma factor [Porticoccus sp. W117]
MATETRPKSLMARLFAEHSGRLQHYLRKRLASDADAQELSQEAYLRLLRVKKIDLIRHPEAYLYRIARNLVHELYSGRPQKESHSIDELVEAESPSLQGTPLEDEADKTRRLARIESLLGELSPKCRAVLILYWRDGLTQQEIANELGLSRSMAQKYMAQGLAYCQKKLDGKHDE